MESLQFIETAKGKKAALHLGYRYTVKKSTTTTRYWKCIKQGCNGRLTTRIESGNFFTGGEHDHGADEGVLEVEKCKAVCRKRAMEEIIPIPQIYAQEFAKIADAGINLVANTPRFSSIDASLYRVRKKALGFPMNCTRREDIRLTGEWIKTSDGKQFLVIDEGADNRILGFASPSSLSTLSSTSLVMMDGTFKSCCSEFKQLYSIHGDIGSDFESTQVVPLLYALLPDKTKSTYIRLFQAIQRLCPLWHPSTIKMDYEQSAILAVQEVFPEVSVNGCNFHFNQCIWRKVQDLGMVKLYRENDEIRNHVRKIAALAFLPKHLLDEGWTSVMSYSPNISKVEDFNDYFVETWLENSVYSDLWNCASQRHRTTNAAEGWHNRLNRWIGKAHPNVFHLINALKQDETSFRLSAAQTEYGIPLPKRRKIYRALDQRIGNLLTNLNDGKISVIRYLEIVSNIVKI